MFGFKRNDKISDKKFCKLYFKAVNKTAKISKHIEKNTANIKRMEAALQRATLAGDKTACNLLNWAIDRAQKERDANKEILSSYQRLLSYMGAVAALADINPARV